MVRVCWLCQNQCCFCLQPNRLCDKLRPTAIDGSVMSQYLSSYM
uniref:Radical SAM superfamily n=1 Tax=Siphoviridae sp. ct4Ap70 TaxID=2825328 RepID=A0A8S5NXD8_9CAUD|nr:MAG TPA: Radical SAM superfamily [Siphoviridae sp. ct4Ap70]